MNDFTKKMFDLYELEQYARRQNTINHIHPAIKIIITLIYSVWVTSLGKYDLNMVLMLGVYPVFLVIVLEVPGSNFLSKMIIPAALSISLGLANLFLDREIMLRIGTIAVSGGAISFMTLFIKSMLTISATLLLVSTTTMSALGNGMRTLKVPKAVVMLLLLMYRYISVLSSETERTIEAYRLRSPGSKGIHISTWGSLVGQIIIKAYRRSEEIYNAMCLRGYGVGEE